MKKVEQLIAFIAINEKEEGICAFMDYHSETFLPMVLAYPSEEVFSKMVEAAKDISKTTGQVIEARRFTDMQTIMRILPDETEQ